MKKLKLRHGKVTYRDQIPGKARRRRRSGLWASSPHLKLELYRDLKEALRDEPGD